MDNRDYNVLISNKYYRIYFSILAYNVNRKLSAYLAQGLLILSLKSNNKNI